MSTSANYSIKDLETLTDIKSHTIRIWEKRYNILNPDRSDTNIRQYDNDDLTKLLNVSMLNKQGYKISKIAVMSSAEIRDLLIKSLDKSEHDDIINGLIIGMIELDERQCSLMVENATAKLGFEKTIDQIIFPFFHRIGVMWQTGAINPAQEHFITHFVRQKVISATDQLDYNPNKSLPKFLLLLPEKELHELTLLFCNYVLRSKNYETIYLSQAVPIHNLSRMVSISEPDAIICYMTNPLSDAEIENIISHLNMMKNTTSFVGGAAIKGFHGALGNNVLRFNHLDEIISHYKTL